MNICPVKAELFHADGQTNRWTDRQEETVSRFLYCCERAYKRSEISVEKAVRLIKYSVLRIYCQLSVNKLYTVKLLSMI
jgi:hypothetical protein